jgi:hypothetical protein
VFVNAVNCTLISPVQFARYLVASQPWCPSLASLHSALLAIGAERGAPGGRGSGGCGASGVSAAWGGPGPPPSHGGGSAANESTL